MSTALDAVWDWFRVLHDTTGIKLTIFYDAFDRARFFYGFLTSIRLMAVCLVSSVALGVVGAWLQGARLEWLRLATQAYIQFFRNTPPLVQLYFFYFALGAYLRVAGASGLSGRLVSNFTWAAICLSLYAGAFNVEIFRAGIEAVPRETAEAAESLGYSRLEAYVYVILPLAFRISLPALNHNLVNLVKTTTIAYAIAVPEMLYVANQIWSDELNVPEMMNVLLVIYVALVGVVVYLMGRWERAMRIPGYTILKWTPLLAQGFALNIAMSFLAMAIGTALGLPLGLGLISLMPPVRASSWLITQFFRNAPWLVVLFYCILLMPFEVRIGGIIVPLPGWAKSTAGLALPVMANVAELVRGAVQSVPSGQWEASEALAFTRLQTLRMVILPQWVRRMTPPWMNLYAILTVAIPLTSVVDLSEAMTF